MNVDALTDTRRLRLAEDLVELNVTTLEQLATLRDLNAAYGTLPGLHGSLAEAVSPADLSLRELASICVPYAIGTVPSRETR